MNIYVKSNSKSFVSVDLENKLASTRCGYPDKFFKNLSAGIYSMFSFDSLRVVYANEKEIQFSSSTFNINDEKDFEIYTYIGIANNTEELLNLLKDLD